MSDGPADFDTEITDFDEALELLSELEGHVVAVGILAPGDAPAMRAVMRGRLKGAAPWDPSTDPRVSRTAFVGLEGGPPSMGHWGSQGLYLSLPDFEYAKRAAGGVFVALRHIEFRISLDERDSRLEGHDHLRRAALTRRRWRAPPATDVRAWRTPDGHRWESPDPTAEPMGSGWAPVEPLGWDHDHCKLCWAELMDPESSTEARRYVDEHPGVFTEGYALVDEETHDRWICPRCFDDLADQFEWQVLED